MLEVNMIRKIIKIDEEKCNGCGACAAACHEGAIQMIDGKAKLTKEHYCDGLGDCLPACPMEAISFEEREAPAYDEAAVLASKVGVLSYVEVPESRRLDTSVVSGCTRPIPQVQTTPGCAGSSIREMPQMPTPPGCPGSVVREMPQMPTPPSRPEGIVHAIPQMPQRPDSMKKVPDDYEVNYKVPSRLKQWPVQIKLMPTEAPFYDKAHLLIAADCTAFAYGNFHEDFMKNKVTLIGCPKLDAVDYYEKLVEIIRNNNIKSVTVVRMTVPCCGGIENAVKRALQDSGKFMPWQVVIVSPEGKIVE